MSDIRESRVLERGVRHVMGATRGTWSTTPGSTGSTIVALQHEAREPCRTYIAAAITGHDIALSAALLR